MRHACLTQPGRQLLNKRHTWASRPQALSVFARIMVNLILTSCSISTGSRTRIGVPDQKWGVWGTLWLQTGHWGPNTVWTGKL